MTDAEIKTAIAFLYDLTPFRPSHVNSYGLKHEVEDLIGTYVSNEDAIRCGLEMGLAHTAGSPNYIFHIRPKFEMWWLLNNIKTKPRGARKTQWEAYLTALEWATQRRVSPVALATEEQTDA